MYVKRSKLHFKHAYRVYLALLLLKSLNICLNQFSFLFYDFCSWDVESWKTETAWKWIVIHVSTGTRHSTSTPSKENFRNLCFDLLMETYDISWIDPNIVLSSQSKEIFGKQTDFLVTIWHLLVTCLRSQPRVLVHSVQSKYLEHFSLIKSLNSVFWAIFETDSKFNNDLSFVYSWWISGIPAPSSATPSPTPASAKTSDVKKEAGLVGVVAKV